MRRPFHFLLLAAALAAPGIAAGEGAPTAECGAEADRCTVSAVLATDTGERFGTIGLQMGRDGSEPVAFALTPLGIAVQPGVRIVINGKDDLPLAVDACFPDGCRATAALRPEQLAALAAAERLSLQFFAFGADKPLSGDLDAPGLGEAARAAGVTLP